MERLDTETPLGLKQTVDREEKQNQKHREREMRQDAEVADKLDRNHKDRR